MEFVVSRIAGVCGEAGGIILIPPTSDIRHPTSGFAQQIGTVTGFGEITVALGEPQEIPEGLTAATAVYTRAGYGQGLTLATRHAGWGPSDLCPKHLVTHNQSDGGDFRRGFDATELRPA
jgi:hypothetical protein